MKDIYIPLMIAAEKMGIHHCSLRNYIRAGKIRAKKINGTRWFVLEKDIKRFLNNEIDLSGTYAQ